MPSYKLTSDQLAQILAIDNNGNGDRPGAYVRLWQLTGSKEALLQARISSFSGGPGGTSFAANLQLQKELGSGYPGVFPLSEAVFQDSIKNVTRNLSDIDLGKKSLDQALFDGAKAAWKAQHLEKDFPGNIFSIIPGSPEFMDGSFFTTGSKVAFKGLGQAGSYGKTPDDFIGQPGYSAHMVAGVNGQKLLTIKEDKTGRTLYVGDGGEWEQKLYDHALIDGPGQSPGDILVRPNLLHRQALQSLRQHQEPGEIDISKTGVIKLLNSAKTQAMQAKSKKSAFLQMHQRLLQRAQARFAVAPVKTRLGVAVPVRRQAVGEAEAAAVSLRAGVSPGAATLRGQGAGRAAVQPGLGAKAKTGAIPWPIAPRGAAAQIAAGLAKRATLGAPGSLAVMPGGELEGSAILPSRAEAAGQAVLSPRPAVSREARRGAMHNAVTLPDGNAVLVPGQYSAAEAAADMPLHEYEASAQAALDSDLRENFERLMHRESRRPPSGTTGVDWRVAVPWPGLKTL